MVVNFCLGGQIRDVYQCFEFSVSPKLFRRRFSQLKQPPLWLKDSRRRNYEGSSWHLQGHRGSRRKGHVESDQHVEGVWGECKQTTCHVVPDRFCKGAYFSSKIQICKYAGLDFQKRPLRRHLRPSRDWPCLCQVSVPGVPYLGQRADHPEGLGSGPQRGSSGQDRGGSASGLVQIDPDSIADKILARFSDASTSSTMPPCLIVLWTMKTGFTRGVGREVSRAVQSICTEVNNNTSKIANIDGRIRAMEIIVESGMVNQLANKKAEQQSV